MCSTFGGRAPIESPARGRRTRPRRRSAAPALWARSWPIVDEVLFSIAALPHIEPPRCPGHSSTSSGERQQAVVERVEDLASALRLLDREVGPGDVAGEQRVAAEDAPRGSPSAREHERGVLGPVAGGVDGLDHDRRRARAASRRRTARAGSRPRRARGCGSSAPVAAASRPWPETWSAWLWVSSTCSIRHPVQAGEAQVGVDVPLRVDDRRDPAVADQVGGAAEVLVDDLAEEHRPQR